MGIARGIRRGRKFVNFAITAVLAFNRRGFVVRRGIAIVVVAWGRSRRRRSIMIIRGRRKRERRKEWRWRRKKAGR